MFISTLYKPYLVQIGFYFLLILALSHCQKRVEGCTQPIASNYNPEADTDCCCLFYNLQLNVQHLAADSISFFSLNQPFSLNSGDIITPLGFSMLISNIQLINTRNQPFAINDSLNFVLNNGSSEPFADDFTLFEPNAFLYNIGKFTSLDTFARLVFTVGLDTRRVGINPTNIADVANPLSLLAVPMLYDNSNNRYNTAVFRFALNSPVDTISLAFATNIRIELPCPIAVIDGRNTKINLNVYYATLFDNINFRTQTIDTIQTRFKQNLTRSFEVQR